MTGWSGGVAERAGATVMSGIDGEGARDIAGRPGGVYELREQCREVRGGGYSF